MAFLLKGNAQNYYVYSDGNSNSYTLDEKKLVYTPVNPEESSSGTYSGGKGKRAEITKDTFKKLSTLLDQVVSEKEQQQEKREMGTALIAKYSKGKLRKKAILKMNASNKQKVENAFKEVLK